MRAARPHLLHAQNPNRVEASDLEVSEVEAESDGAVSSADVRRQNVEGVNGVDSETRNTCRTDASRT